MRSADWIRQDHRVIGGVLGALGEILDGGHPAAVPGPLVSGATEFFGAFVDRCHGAAEDALFPALARHGLLTDEAQRVAAQEHEEGRRLLGDLHPGRAGRARDPAPRLAAYVAFKRRHMAMEETTVVPPAETLPPAEDERMLEEFHRIERRAVGAGWRDALLALAGALTEACRKLGAELPPARRRLTACDLVRPPQATIDPDESLAHASERMSVLGMRELAVVQQGRLVGMLTWTDIEPHRGHLEWTLVRTAMTPRPVTIPRDAGVGVIARVLLERGFNSVPVMAGTQLVGLVRRADLLRLLAGEDKA